MSMRKKRAGFTEEERECIAMAMRGVHPAHVVKRLMALKLTLIDGLSSEEAGKCAGLHTTSVNRNIRKYKCEGIEAITGKRHIHGKRYMSNEEEAAFLMTFRKRGEAGQVVEVTEIHRAYQEAVGHPVTRNAIYYILKKHKWRKVMPRGRYPKKASPEAIEAYEKNHKRCPNAENVQAEPAREVSGRGWTWSDQ